MDHKKLRDLAMAAIDKMQYSLYGSAPYVSELDAKIQLTWLQEMARGNYTTAMEKMPKYVSSRPWAYASPQATTESFCKDLHAAGLALRGLFK
jgi:hypothetical protein